MRKENIGSKKSGSFNTLKATDFVKSIWIVSTLLSGSPVLTTVFFKHSQNEKYVAH